MRGSHARPLTMAALAAVAIMGAGFGLPAASFEEWPRPPAAEGPADPVPETIVQELPDLSEEPHDEAALEAENDRLLRCLAAAGLTEVESELTFDGPRVTHRLEIHRRGSPLSAEQAHEVEAECTARLAVLITDFEPAR